MTTFTEPSDYDIAIAERMQMGYPAVGPLTQEQDAHAEAYERYCEEVYAEHLAEMAAGGRTICPECGKRTVTHRSVVTYGYASHPEAEWSDLAACENCDYRDL